MSRPVLIHTSFLASLVIALIPSCTIDFDAPFNESGWYGTADASPDGSADASAEGEAGTDAADATDEETDAPLDGQDETEAGSCDDGRTNGTETDVDCGGSCPPCSQGMACGSNTDCATDHCVDGVCCESACTGRCVACSADKTGVQDGTCEDVLDGTDPDAECSGGYDCRQGACESCNDGLQNGEEAAIDCGGSCPPCNEDCTNGVDDNANGLVDCEDPLCGSFGCAPSVPSGWTGPLWFYTGSGPLPDCTPSDTAATGGLSIDSYPAASCSPCECGAPVGQTCPAPVVELFDPVTCGGVPDLSVVPQPNQCTSITDTVQYDGAWVLPEQPSGGSCTPSGGDPTVDPFEFEEQALLCEPNSSASGAGCGDGVGCMQLPPSPYQSALCIARSGVLSCPAAGQQRTIMYTSVSDTRGCTSCSCSSSSGATCGGTVTVFGTSTCLSAENPLPMDGSCEQLFGSTYFEGIRYEPDDPVGGKCAALGGAPTGSVEGQGALTVCCE